MSSTRGRTSVPRGAGLGRRLVRRATWAARGFTRRHHAARTLILIGRPAWALDASAARVSARQGPTWKRHLERLRAPPAPRRTLPPAGEGRRLGARRRASWRVSCGPNLVRRSSRRARSGPRPSDRPTLVSLALEPESPLGAMRVQRTSRRHPGGGPKRALRAGAPPLPQRSAAADFLLALAGFDRRRGWERLGHASLFGFLTRELALSAGAAQLRLSAARLLPRHPAVEAAIRDGRLCISAVGQLARVLTPENEAASCPASSAAPPGRPWRWWPSSRRGLHLRYGRW